MKDGTIKIYAKTIKNIDDESALALKNTNYEKVVSDDIPQSVKPSSYYYELFKPYQWSKL